MKKLFYVVLFNRRTNIYSRWLITADAEQSARDTLKEAMGDNWYVERSEYTCDTPQDVMTEV